MYEVSGELNVILITNWWLQKLGKLNELEVRKQYQNETANRSAALENLSEDDDINMTWENFKENIKTSAKDSLGLQEMKLHKP